MHGQGREFSLGIGSASTGQDFVLFGISACMAREGSFTHVRCELRPRAGISACMVTGGGVLLMLGTSSGQGLFWDID